MLTALVAKGRCRAKASYLAAYTLFYGGIASLATVRGIVLETDVQLVVVLVLGFGLLDVASQKFRSWYWHLRSLIREDDDAAGSQGIFTSIYNLVFFIRFVVLLLQFVFIWLWMSTVSHNRTTGRGLYIVTYVLGWLYWGMSLLGLLYEIALKIRAMTALQKMKTISDPDGVVLYHYYNLWSDGVFTIFAGIVFLVFVFVYMMHNGLKTDDRLLRDIKLQYASLNHVEVASACDTGFYKSSMYGHFAKFRCQPIRQDMDFRSTRRMAEERSSTGCL